MSRKFTTCSRKAAHCLDEKLWAFQTSSKGSQPVRVCGTGTSRADGEQGPQHAGVVPLENTQHFRDPAATEALRHPACNAAPRKNPFRRPVLGETAMLPLKIILHPTDLSEQSEAAYRVACAVARDHGA